jgi:hypothetical protein
MKLDFEKLLEDRDALMSLEQLRELVRNEFLNLSNSIKLEDIMVKFHNYGDGKYDFYVEVKRITYKHNDESKECIQFEENYRLKDKEIIQIVNNYLKDYKLKIKQNDSNKVYHFTLSTNANPETRDDVNFFYRFEELTEEKYSH